MPKVTHTFFAAVLAAGFMASGCANQVGLGAAADDKKGDTPPVVKSFTQFPDLPRPTGSKIDLDRTLIFGAGESWFGKLLLNASNSANEIFDFYKQELPGYGWQEITSVRSKLSVLTYARQGRIATIQIQSGSLSGAEITLTVSPRGAQNQPEVAPGYPSPATGVGMGGGGSSAMPSPPPQNRYQ